MVAPDRLQLVFYMPSSGANEIRVPLGYWAGVAIWCWLAARLLAVPVTGVAARAVCIGFAVHALVLLASYAPRLADPAGFSSPDHLLVLAPLHGRDPRRRHGVGRACRGAVVTNASAAIAAFDLPVVFAALILAVAARSH